MKTKLQNLAALAAHQYARLGVAAGTAMMAVSSHAAGVDDLFDEIDLAGISAKVLALGLIIVGISLVIKGPAIVKRIVAKI
ncbi:MULTISPECIES: hypothetical protein [unclassified Comamonas]|uniref:hypothetical protein n=1 Tax=unclassified Comamonas TaxID=2638500 RepID=UPI001EFAA1F3|nr:hypothetical protein [Comamonas sp. B21-038]ULR90837.1 hypothetical protein MJ205_08330 [Comamonas sp. B21-038]